MRGTPGIDIGPAPTASTFGNSVPVKKKKFLSCVCVCWEGGWCWAEEGKLAGSPSVARSPEPSEKVWMRNDFGAWLSVSFAAASGNFQECCSGPAGGCFRRHFYELQTPSVADQPAEGNVTVSFSSALPLRVQFIFHRQQLFRLCPVPQGSEPLQPGQLIQKGPAARRSSLRERLTSVRDAAKIYSNLRGETPSQNVSMFY